MKKFKDLTQLDLITIATIINGLAIILIAIRIW